MSRTNLILAALKIWAMLAGFVLGQCPGGFCPLPSQPYPAAPLVPVVRPSEAERQPYHAAVVRVIGNKYGGSGTLVAREGELGIVLTNHHVVEGSTKYWVEYASGNWRKSTAFLIGSDPSLDLAALWVGVPQGVEPIPVAETKPNKGDAIQLCGYGGNRWKALQGHVLGYTTHLTQERDNIGITPLSVSGDSGGGILKVDNGRVELVGVLWGGPLASSRGPMTATHGAHCEAVRGWLRRVVCPRYPYCLPQQRPQVRPPQAQPGGGYKPGDVVEQPPAQVPQLPAQPPQPPAQDWSAQFASFDLRIKAIEARKPCECDHAAITARIDAQQQQIKAIAPRLDSLAKLIEGYKPCECGPQVPPPAPADPVAHVVVVADKGSRDWPRLSAYIEAAQQHYSGLRVTDLPPFPIGTIPQAVVYRGGIPVKTFKGRQDVEQLLDELRREKAPTL